VQPARIQTECATCCERDAAVWAAGARALLSTGLLRAAAVGYCTSRRQAKAPGNWFEQALRYTVGKLHGAVAALSPAGARIG